MTSSPRVAVLDYGSGNIRSAVRALERAGADVTLTSDPDAVSSAHGLVVPGVGAFAAVMAQLRAVGGPEMIARRLDEDRPVLGICVGMQVLFSSGVEHGVLTEGLGYLSGTVERLEADVVPHMGWSRLRPPDGSVLFAGLEQEHFYFVHSYAAQTAPRNQRDDVAPGVTWAEHGGDFVAAVEAGPLSATQFHPEKSGDAGGRLLTNWIAQL